jgi:hypothetical protein
VDDTTCDGIDDDCNGTADDGYVSVPTSCGLGVCASSGSTSCVGGVEQDSCVPGTPVEEICANTLDDDCDGSTDEQFDVDGDGYFTCNTGSGGAGSAGNACSLIQSVTARQSSTADPAARVRAFDGARQTGWDSLPDSSGRGLKEDDNGTYTNDCDNTTSGPLGPNKMEIRDRGINGTKYLHVDTGVPNGLSLSNLTVRIWGSDDKGDGTCRGSQTWADHQSVYVYVYGTDSDSLASTSPTIFTIAGIVTAGPNTPNGCTTDYIDLDLLPVYNQASTPSTGNFEIRVVVEGGGGLNTDVGTRSGLGEVVYVDWKETGGPADCDDGDPFVNPGATEGPIGDPTCSDLKDNDCDGSFDAVDTGCQ